MKQHRWLPWIDVAVFAGIPTLITLAVGAALFFEQPWPPVKVGFAVGVPLVSWGTFVALVITKWRTQPTYTLPMGTRVWTNGIAAATPEMMTEALRLYAVMVGRAHKQLDSQTVLAMLGCARIEFRRNRVWGKSGLQQGNGVLVYWLEGPGYNALFHELHHMVDQLLLGREPDYKHERKPWWDLIGDIKRAFREGPHGQALSRA